MRARIASLVAAALMLTSAGALRAQTISVSGNPGLLRISSAVAGTEPTSVSDATRTYTITTPAAGNFKYAVTAQLNANMPANVTLSASAAAPPGSAGASLGPIALDVTARQLINNIKKNYTGTAAITYTLAATTAAGVVPNSSRIVTLTIFVYP